MAGNRHPSRLEALIAQAIAKFGPCSASELTEYLYPDDPELRTKLSKVAVTLKRMEKKGLAVRGEKGAKGVPYGLKEGLPEAQPQAEALPPAAEIFVEKEERAAVRRIPAGERVRRIEAKETVTRVTEIKVTDEPQLSLKEKVLEEIRSGKDLSAADLAERLLGAADKNAISGLTVCLHRLEEEGYLDSRKEGRRRLYNLREIEIEPETGAIKRKAPGLRTLEGLEGAVFKQIKLTGRSSASEIARRLNENATRADTNKVYTTIQRLEEKGLVFRGGQSGRKTYYVSEKPLLPRIEVPSIELPSVSVPHIPRTYAATGISLVIALLIFYNFTGGMGFFTAPNHVLALSLDQQQLGGLENFMYGVKNINSHSVDNVRIEAVLPFGSDITDYGGAQVEQRGGVTVLTWLVSQINPNEKQMFSFSGKVPGQVKLYATGMSEQERQLTEVVDKPVQARLPAGEYGYRKLDVTPIGYLGEVAITLSAGAENATFTNETVSVPEIPITHVTENITTIEVNETLPTPPAPNVTPPVEQPVPNATQATPAQPSQPVTPPIEQPTPNVTPPEQPTPNVTLPAQPTQPPTPPAEQPTENATPPVEQPFAPNATPPSAENVTPPAENATPPTGGVVTPPEQNEQQPAPPEPPKPITHVKIYLDPDTAMNGNEDLIGEQDIFTEWDGTMRVTLPAKKYNESMNLVFYSDRGATVLVKALDLKWVVEVPVNSTETVDILKEIYNNITTNLTNATNVTQNITENVTLNVTQNITENVTVTVEVIDARGQYVDADVTLADSKGAKAEETNAPRGLAGQLAQVAGVKGKQHVFKAAKEARQITVKPKATAVKDLSFSGVSGDNVTLGLDTPPAGLEGFQGMTNWSQGYAINPAAFNFASGSATITAKGTDLYKCKDWNFTGQYCGGEWVKIMDLTPGQDYTLQLSAGDPLYLEYNLTTRTTFGHVAWISCNAGVTPPTGGPAIANDEAASTTNYSYMSAVDTNNAACGTNKLNQSVRVQWHLNYTQKQIINFTIGWYGYYSGSGGRPTDMLIWNWTSGAWVRGPSVSASSEGWMSMFMTGANVTNMMNSSSYIIFAVKNSKTASGNQNLLTDYVNITVYADAQTPSWQRQSQNNSAPEAGGFVNLSVIWSDDNALNKATLATNETGAWQNKTLNYSSVYTLSGTSAQAVFNWSNASVTNGKVIGWRVYANDTSGNDNVTNIMTFTVTTDVTPPLWSGNTSSIQSVYSTTVSGFNITWTDANGIGTALLENNFTGTAHNDTMFRYNSSLFGYNESIPAGTYYWESFANDTSAAKNQNKTDMIVFTVSKAPTLTDLYLNGTEANTAYTTNDIANFTATVNATGKTVYIYSNMTGWILQSGTTPLKNYTALAVNGKYNMTAYIPADANYSASSQTYYATVNSPMNITLTSPENNYNSRGGAIFNCSANDTGGISAIVFYWNYSGSLIANGTVLIDANSGSASFRRPSLRNGGITWTCWANNTAGDKSGSASSRIVNITSPYLVENATWESGLTGVEYGSVASGDINNDGYTDEVICGFSAASTGDCRVYMNNGTSLVENNTWDSEILQRGNGPVALADVNGDGLLDLFVSGYMTHSPSAYIDSDIYINNGTAFAIDSGWTGDALNVYSGGAMFGDVNNDGKPDLALFGYVSGDTPSAQILLNNGSSFANSTAWGKYLVPVGAIIDAAWVDLNKDGRLDLIAIGYNGTAGADMFNIYLNNGTTLLRNKSWESGLTGTELGGFWVGDVDGNGYSDIVITGDAYPGPVKTAKIYMNNGTGLKENTTWESKLSGVNGGGDISGADIENDGDYDLLLAGYNGAIRPIDIQQWSGNSYVPNNSYRSNLTNVSVPGMDWVDLNNDGVLDLILTGYTASSTRIAKVYEQRIDVTNAQPNPPNVLTASYSNGNFTVTWDGATDTETANASLDYNLRIGTTPAKTAARSREPTGNDVVSGVLGGNGRTDNQRQGNMRSMKNFTLGGTDKDYWWSVQTIDTGLDQSAWSTEQYYDSPGDKFQYNSTWSQGLYGMYTGSAAFGDIDGDGKTDMIQTGENNNYWWGKTVVYINNGTSLVENSTWESNLTDVDYSSLALCDLNSDGRLELLLMGWKNSIYAYNNTIKVYSNNGTSFIENATLGGDFATAMVNGAISGDISCADIDGDGKLDVGFQGSNYTNAGITTAIFINNGTALRKNATWGKMLTQAYAGAFKFGDLNGDGRLDAVQNGWTEPNTDQISMVYINNGTMLVPNKTWNETMRAMREGGLALGDLDGDGTLDAVGTGWSQDAGKTYTDVYINNGSSLVLNSSWLPYVNASEDGTVVLGDVNNDGKLDMALAGYNTTHILGGHRVDEAGIYLNNGTALIYDYNYSKNLRGASGLGYINLVDLDSDGALDAMVSGYDGTNGELRHSEIYRNRLVNNAANTAPNSPTTFSSSYAGGKLNLTWSGATDSQGGTLYYNIKVGTCSGCDDVVTGTYGYSGRHESQQFGNMQQRSSINLTVPQTTYYWSVQAIDAGYMNSSWSTEQTYSPTATQPPQYTINGSNTTVPDAFTAVLLYANWTGGSWAWLQTNETGVWEDKSATYAPIDVSSQGWSNFTWQNNSMDGNSVVGWKIYANSTDGSQNTTATGTFTISSLVSISLTQSSIDFGSMSSGSSNDTAGNTPTPFNVRNDGNVKVNLTINATNMWSASANPSSNYMYAANNSSEGVTYNGVCSDTAWTNMPAYNAPRLFLCFLEWLDAKDEANIDIAVTVPTEEQNGAKSSTVTIIATQA